MKREACRDEPPLTRRIADQAGARGEVIGGKGLFHGYGGKGEVGQIAGPVGLGQPPRLGEAVHG